MGRAAGGVDNEVRGEGGRVAVVAVGHAQSGDGTVGGDQIDRLVLVEKGDVVDGFDAAADVEFHERAAGLVVDQRLGVVQAAGAVQWCGPTWVYTRDGSLTMAPAAASSLSTPGSSSSSTCVPRVRNWCR